MQLRGRPVLHSNHSKELINYPKRAGRNGGWAMHRRQKHDEYDADYLTDCSAPRALHLSLGASYADIRASELAAWASSTYATAVVPFEAGRIGRVEGAAVRHG